MRSFFVALSLAALGATLAHADDTNKVIWTSAAATGQVIDRNGMVVEYCHATIRVDLHGKHFYNPNECLVPNIHNYVSMSWPIGEPPINMKGIREATTVRVNPRTGMLELR